MSAFRSLIAVVALAGAASVEAQLSFTPEEYAKAATALDARVKDFVGAFCKQDTSGTCELAKTTCEAPAHLISCIYNGLYTTLMYKEWCGPRAVADCVADNKANEKKVIGFVQQHAATPGPGTKVIDICDSASVVNPASATTRNMAKEMDAVDTRLGRFHDYGKFWDCVEAQSIKFKPAK